MPIYINKNNQQSGPYEDHIVIDQLRNGMLSPNDMGIRHGESTWQRLGDMFPQVSAAPAPTPPPIAAVPSAKSAAQFASPGHTPKPTGGCRKPLGWTTLGIGILLMLVGIGFTLFTTFQYSTLSCDFADSDYKEVEELLAKYKAAEGTPEEGVIKYQLDSAMAGYDASAKNCADATSTKRMFQAAGVAVGVIGFLMLIVGFFIRRV